MPDTRAHRGPHPEDAALFAPAQWPRLRLAVEELSWLLGRGYAQPSALKVVGDRHALNARQRVAVMRCACADPAREGRCARQVAPEEAPGRPLFIDGYNVLTTVEVALGGGVVFIARDGTARDVASMHGTWRKVAETVPAARLVGQVLGDLRPANCTWFLDSPVSNSARLRATLLDVAQEQGRDWQVDLVPDADAALGRSDGIIATADSVVLDRCGPWLNLARLVVERCVPSACVVDLSG